jgi:hypothetical protein
MIDPSQKNIKSLSKLGEDDLKIIDERHLNISKATIFEMYTKSDGSLTLLKSFLRGDLNNNDLIQALQDLDDLSRQTKQSHRKVYENILKEVNDTGNDHAIKKAIYTKRRPLLTTRQKNFETHRNEIQKDKISKISHTPFFEDDNIILTVKLKHLKDIETLQNTLEKKNWSQLLKE